MLKVHRHIARHESRDYARLVYSCAHKFSGIVFSTSLILLSIKKIIFPSHHMMRLGKLPTHHNCLFRKPIADILFQELTFLDISFGLKHPWDWFNFCLFFFSWLREGFRDADEWFVVEISCCSLKIIYIHSATSVGFFTFQFWNSKVALKAHWAESYSTLVDWNVRNILRILL